MIRASSKKILVMYKNGSKNYVLTVKQFHSMTAGVFPHQTESCVWGMQYQSGMEMVGGECGGDL
jgi:hypothetical protein